MRKENVKLQDVVYLLQEKDFLSAHTKITKEALGQAVQGTDCDSRVADKGNLFICKGKAFKTDFLKSALDKGAVCYMCSASKASALQSSFPNAESLVVKDEALRPAMAAVSSLAWGHPDEDLCVIGITGTKGKSTTSYMLKSIIDAKKEAMGSKDASSIIGSITTDDGICVCASANTTPEPPDLWRHLANAQASSHNPVVMEISSQALKYDRVSGLHLDIACFLNISTDHISPVEHPNFEDYFHSKLKIFKHSQTAVVNLQSDHIAEILKAAKGLRSCVGFSTDSARVCGKKPDVWADNVCSRDGRTSFVAHTPSWSQSLSLNIPGIFNLENALCAISCAYLLGIEPIYISKGLARSRVPGRMEVVPSPDPHIYAIVDYAHNLLSFQRFFSSVKKEFPQRKIIAVFGAVGSKAEERRYELPKEAARWADRLIFTTDDPGYENPADICAEMMKAIPQESSAEIVLDREKAIQRAIDIAYEDKKPALICLLAKGAQNTQHIRDEFVPCDTDGEIFLKAMKVHRDI